MINFADTSTLVSIATLIGLVFFFKNKADGSGAAALLGELKGKDEVLSKQQDELQKKIDHINNQDDSKLTPEERAARWGK